VSRFMAVVLMMGGLLVAGGANAAATITLSEVSGAVEATLTGTLNTAGLTLAVVNVPDKGRALPASAYAVVASPFGPPSDSYSGISGPTSLGSGSLTSFATSGTGGPVGVDMTSPPYLLIVPNGFVNGSVSGSAEWAGLTFSAMGLTPGTYTYSWGSDSLTIQIGPVPASIPSLSEWTHSMLALMTITVIGWHIRKQQE